MTQVPNHPSRRPVEVAVPDHAWQVADYDDEAPPEHYLLASLVLNGTAMHLEAFLVAPGSDPQRTYASDEALTVIAHAMGADGPWETTTVRGREYVLIATPVS